MVEVYNSRRCGLKNVESGSDGQKRVSDGWLHSLLSGKRAGAGEGEEVKEGREGGRKEETNNKTGGIRLLNCLGRGNLCIKGRGHS